MGGLFAFFDPINFQQDNFEGVYTEWFGIPYSSYMHIELHKINKCEDIDMTGKCWQVMIYANG